jgi:ABC-type transport system involved in cytochrome bd biosynthesis fused ATPase/permease subunit
VSFYQCKWGRKRVAPYLPAQSNMCFVGASGSGKAPAVDEMLGLLEPQEGRLSKDGQVSTTASRLPWQRAIGYVPQHINKSDDSVFANIAFGVANKGIEPQAVQHSAKVDNLREFVSNDLLQGHATAVGDRGERLSGGQCQHMGIARAISQPSSADSGEGHQRRGGICTRIIASFV